MVAVSLSWLAQRVFPELMAVIWKSVAIIAIAGLIAYSLRRASAALRHLVWLTALVSLLGPPWLCCLLPAWHTPMAMPHSAFFRVSAANTTSIPPAPQSLLTAPPSQPAASAVTLDKSVVPASPVQERESEVAPTAWGLWLMTVWLLGVGCMLLRMLLGVVAVRRHLLQCPPLTDGSVAALAERVLGDLGVRRAVGLRRNTLGALPSVPFTFGWRRPIILLPDEASGWPAERLRAVLLHEMAHVKRADWPLLLLAQGLCALYWFHPLVWLLAHRLRAESEAACDDLVLTTGIKPTDYAEHLLGIAQDLRGRLPYPAMVAMAHRPDIQTRLQTILQEGVCRQLPARRTGCAAGRRCGSDAASGGLAAGGSGANS